MARPKRPRRKCDALTPWLEEPPEEMFELAAQMRDLVLEYGPDDPVISALLHSSLYRHLSLLLDEPATGDALQ
jgi:hypothetical protein